MQPREYLTTGEAAEMLRISRSTVSRMFDAGTLQGRLNPLTRKRQVSRSSVMAVMASHGLQPPNTLAPPHVLLATTATATRTFVTARVNRLARATLGYCPSGAETLESCARQSPQLLIIDDSLPDLRPADIATALTHRLGRNDCPIIYLTEQFEAEAVRLSDVMRVLPDVGRLAPERLEAVMAELLGLETPTTGPDSRYQHWRRSPRHPLNLEALVTVYSTRPPRRSVQGRARLRNISDGGVFVDNLELQETDLLARPFRMQIVLQDPPMQGWRACCRVVRLASNGSLSAGLEFIRTPRRQQPQLAALTSTSRN